jgi:predicted nucleic acid-binding protein
MKPKVYVETSVIGHLTSWPSGDLIVAGRQKITRDWWQGARGAFELVVSELVYREAGSGDEEAVADRLEAIEGLPVLAIIKPAEVFARALIDSGIVPPSQPEDALHIALAVLNGVEYLVTWNFKHIGNVAIRLKVHDFCIKNGYKPCAICTPEDLLELEDHA